MIQVFFLSFSFVDVNKDMAGFGSVRTAARSANINTLCRTATCSSQRRRNKKNWPRWCVCKENKHKNICDMRFFLLHVFRKFILLKGSDARRID